MMKFTTISLLVIISFSSFLVKAEEANQERSLQAAVPLQNQGKNCWSACHGKQGACGWCGTQGLCCRKGFHVKSGGCDGIIGGNNMHACIPKPSVKPTLKTMPNQGNNCWGPCHGQGKCKYCGTGGICCRNDFGTKSKGCDGVIGGWGQHSCVVDPRFGKGGKGKKPAPKKPSGKKPAPKKPTGKKPAKKPTVKTIKC